MSKYTNLDNKNKACLHLVHLLPHQTSCPTTKSTLPTMVNALIQNFSPHLAGKYGKATKQSTQRRHRADESKGGLHAGRVRAIGALRSLWSKIKLAAKKRRETHFLSNEENKNVSRVRLRERPLGQECESKTQRQRFSESRTIRGTLKTPE